MFDKSIIQDKSRELLAVENLTLESDALTIIRLCKDLLTITRGLRETWCLGTMKVNTNQVNEKASDEEIQAVFKKFNELTDRISALERS
ncbi:CIC11C00000004385 [Sungouiella intermedia]|uniref:CIC11C00000004385 n=1 Tax=Sungouiella intermedia TaxID=45354 RepID=A0A1L0C578_9ASCO|nr:CIC11C00000004385 [[Candida] intermedia]SGZ58683.1 CIC11C00000004637 [[Candida] intermedia]